MVNDSVHLMNCKIEIGKLRNRKIGNLRKEHQLNETELQENVPDMECINLKCIAFDRRTRYTFGWDGESEWSHADARDLIRAGIFFCNLFLFFSSGECDCGRCCGGIGATH